MKAKKAIVIAICAVVLVLATVFATVAYFTSTAEVQNAFSIGKVKITLDETKVNEDGTPVTPAAKTTTGNTYKLVPAAKYTKDPTVHVETGSETSYLFVKISNNIKNIEANETTTNKKIATQIINNGWTALPDNSGVYYKLYDASSPVADHPVFGYFTIKADATANTLESYNGRYVSVKAYAVQKEGLATPADAWAVANVD